MVRESYGYLTVWPGKPLELMPDGVLTSRVQRDNDNAALQVIFNRYRGFVSEWLIHFYPRNLLERDIAFTEVLVACILD